MYEAEQGITPLSSEYINNAAAVAGGAFVGAMASEAAKDVYHAAKEYVKDKVEGKYFKGSDRLETQPNNYFDLK